MYLMLVGAGLGNQKIEFSSSDKHNDVVKRITDAYPRLAKCGSFTLHKSQDGETPNDPYKKLIQGGMMLSNYEKNITQGKE